MTAESMTGVYAIFIFLGIGQGGFLPSAMNLVYEFSGTGDPKTTMAIIDTLLMPFTIIAIILAGYFKPIVGTDSILAAIVVSVAIGILLLVFIVKDPRKTATDDTISIIN
jgi:multisubunit Na+/H+ antiporter MnhC subunit